MTDGPPPPPPMPANFSVGKKAPTVLHNNSSQQSKSTPSSTLQKQSSSGTVGGTDLMSEILARRNKMMKSESSGVDQQQQQMGKETETAGKFSVPTLKKTSTPTIPPTVHVSETSHKSEPDSQATNSVKDLAKRFAAMQASSDDKNNTPPVSSVKSTRTGSLKNNPFVSNGDNITSSSTGFAKKDKPILENKEPLQPAKNVPDFHREHVQKEVTKPVEIPEPVTKSQNRPSLEQKQIPQAPPVFQPKTQPVTQEIAPPVSHVTQSDNLSINSSIPKNVPPVFQPQVPKQTSTQPVQSFQPVSGISHSSTQPANRQSIGSPKPQLVHPQNYYGNDTILNQQTIPVQTVKSPPLQNNNGYASQANTFTTPPQTNYSSPTMSQFEYYNPNATQTTLGHNPTYRPVPNTNLNNGYSTVNPPMPSYNPSYSIYPTIDPSQQYYNPNIMPNPNYQPQQQQVHPPQQQQLRRPKEQMRSFNKVKRDYEEQLMQSNMGMNTLRNPSSYRLPPTLEPDRKPASKDEEALLRRFYRQ